MRIVLYTNRNVGLFVLSYLVGLGHIVKVITDGDDNVEWLAAELECQIVDIELMFNYDLFICCHGRKIIPKELLKGKMINIHPTQYNGHNPVKRFIENKDTKGSLRAMYMTEKVDEGELIAEETFETGECKTYADYYNIALPYYIKLLSKTLEIVGV